MAIVLPALPAGPAHAYMVEYVEPHGWIVFPPDGPQVRGKTVIFPCPDWPGEFTTLFTRGPLTVLDPW